MNNCPPWCPDQDPGHEYHTGPNVDFGGGWSGHLGQADGEPVRVVTEDPHDILTGCEIAQAGRDATEKRALAELALVRAARTGRPARTAA